MQCCPKSIKTELSRIFSYAMLSGASRTTLHRNMTCSCCLNCVKKTLHKIFSYANLFGASRTTLHRVFTCAMLPQEYQDKNYTECFLMQYCLEPLGQHCIGFRPVQCFPKSMKQNCTGFFSHAMLAGASRTTLH